jgi:hypothetical protein
MFLRCTTRKKNGKEHRYWNLVENRRVAGGQVVQRQVLYLGEQRCGVNRSRSLKMVEALRRTVALFAEDQRAPVDDEQVIQVRLSSDFRLAESHRLYDCHDLLLKHKEALFTHLSERWKDLFNAKFDVLLYDLYNQYLFRKRSTIWRR